MRVLLPPPEPAPTPRILARAACVVLPASWPWTATENRTCRPAISVPAPPASVSRRILAAVRHVGGDDFGCVVYMWLFAAAAALRHGVSAHAIVLEGSTRIPRLREELSRLRLDDTVRLLERQRDPQDGVRGCMQSHQAALRAGLRAGSRAMVVMEDDLEWRSRGWSVSTALDAAINVTTGGGADIVFLGGLPIVPFGPEVSAGVRSPAAMMWTTCYVVSANAAREIVSWSYRGVHYDRELLRLRQASLHPSVAFQRTLWSSELTTVQPDNALYVLAALALSLIGRQRVQRLLEAACTLASPLRRVLGPPLALLGAPSPELLAGAIFLPSRRTVLVLQASSTALGLLAACWALRRRRRRVRFPKAKMRAC